MKAFIHLIIACGDCPDSEQEVRDMGEEAAEVLELEWCGPCDEVYVDNVEMDS